MNEGVLTAQLCGVEVSCRTQRSSGASINRKSLSRQGCKHKQLVQASRGEMEHWLAMKQAILTGARPFEASHLLSLPSADLMTETILAHPTCHLHGRHNAVLWKKNKKSLFLTVCVSLCFMHSSGNFKRIEAFLQTWPQAAVKKKQQLLPAGIKSSPLNRSNKWRPTYQHAVSKLGNGVRVLTFNLFSISYALRRVKHVLTKHHAGYMR